ncbi:response regulator receiver modulated metal dependent phosphohydrolase [Thermanaerovibrio acidaminovorans DSM 6589]|uniref:Response regulator receiver modulated metal dependent phosphohydrolase n=1 Tax=Thermanaerovibrio acidaminovorans (strain ATCC 49978 / DSM 6589 / Su883) TaxID=525903 RepID=D1B6G3_THEAS|nr:HD domain-containing phosphohydrolase [Thermanaerovibrio acidaminovorans]ACZ19604.1 response regulator receiver modulated metal dependent phosphohydrolase [Thermanaerovibrio acidaminovorans DSM 6589]
MIWIERPPTVMVVDDTPENLHVLRGLLESGGVKVRAFPNGPMALKAACQDPPDLIMLDVMMPQMNGFQVARRLREDERTRGIPILFVSALSDTGSKVRAFREGGVDYVTKPFQAEEVMARVRTHLELSMARRELQMHNRHLNDLVNEKVREISDSQMAIILAITRITEYRDSETGMHIERTGHLCKALAMEVARDLVSRVSDQFVENIFHAAPLHDIGKVAIPDQILLKPGKLTGEEFEIMKTHAVIGAEALKAARDRYPNNPFVNMGMEIARWHHERWDGRGYPDGLVGDQIPLSARIMSVVDVYDAIRSRRPYKPPFPHHRAVEMVLEGRGTQFDPMVVEAFVRASDAFQAIHLEMGDGEGEA